MRTCNAAMRCASLLARASLAHRGMRRMAWRQGLVEALYRKAIAPEQADGTAAGLALLEKAAAQVRLPDEGTAEAGGRPPYVGPAGGSAGKGKRERA